MSAIGPAVKEKFDSLPDELKQAVLQQDMKIDTLQDLIACMERIVTNAQ